MLTLTSKADCIFAEAGEPTAVIDVINKESQLPVGILDPTGMALQPGSSLYSQLLQTMANSFVECLQNTH